MTIAISKEEQEKINQSLDSQIPKHKNEDNTHPDKVNESERSVENALGSVEAAPWENLADLEKLVKEAAEGAITLKKEKFQRLMGAISQTICPVYENLIASLSKKEANNVITKLAKKPEWEHCQAEVEILPVFLQYQKLSPTNKAIYDEKISFLPDACLKKIAKLPPIALWKFLDYVKENDLKDRKSIDSVIGLHTVSKLCDNEQVTELHWEALFIKLEGKKAGRKKSAPVMNCDLFNKLKKQVKEAASDETVTTNQVQKAFAEAGFKFKLAQPKGNKKKRLTATEKNKQLLAELETKAKEIISLKEEKESQELRFKQELSEIESNYKKEISSLNEEIITLKQSNAEVENKLNILWKKHQESSAVNNQEKPLKDEEIEEGMEVKVIQSEHWVGETGEVIKKDTLSGKWLIWFDSRKQKGSKVKEQFLAAQLAINCNNQLTIKTQAEIVNN